MASQLLHGRQFDSLQPRPTARKYKTVTKPSKKVADAVYDQLTEDYPKHAIEWVHQTKWKGPVEVPISKVDFSEEKQWAAYHEPEKIRAWKTRIVAAEKKGEHVKPSLLVKRPGKTAMIPDGHHRALAYKELGQPVFAWVANPGKEKGPWDTLHEQQFKDETGPQRGGNPGMYHYGRKQRG